MSYEEELLLSVAPTAERELRSRLQGFFGGMIRHYLPQSWVFRTEEGVAALSVGVDGAVTVGRGSVPQPDVTIEVGHDRLQKALAGPRPSVAPSGPLAVTTHTARGRAAFEQLRGRLGL